MKKFRRKKLAFALACASILGGKTQAMNTNKPQSRQTIAAVGGAATKNSSTGFVDWVKKHKLGVGIGGALVAATVVAFTILGVKYLGKKNKDNNNIDEISNNIKGDKTTNVLDVDNKKINLKINLNQENDKPMSNEEAVKNCMDKLIPALKESIKNKELAEFYHRKVELSLTTILKCENKILELFPNDGQLEERKYNFQQFTKCLKTGRIYFKILGDCCFQICFELPSSPYDDGNGPKVINNSVAVDYRHPKNDWNTITFSNTGFEFFQLLFYPKFDNVQYKLCQKDNLYLLGSNEPN